MTAAPGPGGLGPVRHALVAATRRYHRLQITGDLAAPESPVLFVSNHGFGSLLDLNVITAYAAFEDMDLDLPVTALVHELAWTLGLGPWLETLGAQKAGAEAAKAALEKGHHVLVFPGGDLDAFKAHGDRNRIVFGGRSGFARLAMEAGVPIVPIVTAGAGDTLLVLSDGQRLAKALRLDRLLRLKALPVSLSVPWGLNVGLVGFAPYVPLPVQLRTEVLSPMTAGPDESHQQFAARVERAMTRALDHMVSPNQ
jgi:1-acyl-sn-glycerol-3-phosphate acyltransferase